MQLRTDHRGFTLVELLTVIGIIAVLAGILIPTVNVAIRKAKVARARADVEAIALAAKLYHDEYGRWPAFEFKGDILTRWHGQLRQFNDLNRATTINAYFSRILTGLDRDNNPKGIEFLVVKAENRSRIGALPGVPSSENLWFFADPWGRPYFIAVDDDYQYDPKIAARHQNPPYHNTSAVDVYSAGPDPEPLPQYRYEEAGTFAGAVNNW